MVVSPLVGFGLAYLFMLAILWIFRKANAVRAKRGFRWAQIASAATMAFGHGTQDAQKTMGVIVADPGRVGAPQRARTASRTG